MADQDRIPNEEDGKKAGLTHYNGTKPHEGDRFSVPGARGRADPPESRDEDYVESQPGGRRDDLMDRPNQPPGRKSEGRGE